MSVLGRIVPPLKAGSIHRRRGIVEDLTAPDSDVSVPAGGTATVTVSIASEVPRDVAYAGVESVSGLPSDVYIADISVDKTAKTLTLTLYNPTTADITVSAGSLTIRVVSIA